MAGEIAAIKTTNVQLLPLPVGEPVPVGSLYIDPNSGALSNQSASGAQVIGVIQQMNLKIMIAGAAIPAKYPVAKRGDGRVVAAGSDAGGGGQNFIGFSMEAATGVDQSLNVLLVGVNLEGAVDGLGFAPGEDVYLAEGGGYTNDPNSFTGADDSLIKVGIADCAAGEAVATAKDLITFTDVLTRP